MPPDDQTHDLVPVDHQPDFADEQQVPPAQPSPPEYPSQEIKAIEQVLGRVFNLEMGLAQAVQEIRDTLASIGQNVASLHLAHEKLRTTMAAPKRILRDETGRPTGVVADHSLH